MLKKLSVAIAFTTLVSVGTAGNAFAVSLTETADAGQFLADAQKSDTQPAGTPLDSIVGRIDPAGDIDLYQIFVPGGSFSATTVGGTALNSQLFLFNSGGFGVAASDDAFPSSQSTIPAINLTQGIYYIGISTFGYDPQSSGGPIFDFAAADPATSANGPGGGSPLSSWSEGFPETPDGYSIGLTNAQFVGTQAAVPFEFSPTLGLLLLGTWATVSRMKSK